MKLEKKLGKIRTVSFGFGGYQDAQLGLSVTLGADGWGVGDFSGFWSDDPGEYAKWDKKNQDKYWGEALRELRELLQKAKVKNVADLKGVPVEVVFNGQQLDSWRILEEVL